MNNETSGRRKPRHGRRLGWGRQALLLAALALIVMGVVGGTVAYLVTKTDSVTNTFEPGKVSCDIEETFDSPYTEKKEVKVKNTGNTDAYIRAAIIVTWKDADGNIAATVPQKNVDYTMSAVNGWYLGNDGYYYYQGIVPPQGETAVLFNSIEAKNNHGEYTLSVEILAEAIQASPQDVVYKAWGVSAKSLQGASANN